MSEFPNPTERVRHEWIGQVGAEYRSCAITQDVCSWITRAGLSPDLIHEGLRIADDELVHSELAIAVAQAAGAMKGPDLVRERLAYPCPEDEPLERSLTRACVQVFCLGETNAVPLFKAMRDRCQIPVARIFFDRVLRDEVRHRDFGWVLLRELVEGPMGDELRELAQSVLPDCYAKLRKGYVVDPDTRVITPDEELWGLIPTSLYPEIIDRTVERDYRPRFAAVEIEFPG
jgi:hypothetical protein